MTPSTPPEAAILEALACTLKGLRGFRDCMEAQRIEGPLPPGHDDADESCGDGVCFRSGATIDEDIRALEAAESLVNSLRGELAEHQKYKLDACYAYAWRDERDEAITERDEARAEVERLKAELSEGKANAEWIGNGNAAELFCNKHGYDGCPDCRKENSRLTSLLAAKDEALKKINAMAGAYCLNKNRPEVIEDLLVQAIDITALALTPAKPKEDDNGL